MPTGSPPSKTVGQITIVEEVASVILELLAGNSELPLPLAPDHSTRTKSNPKKLAPFSVMPAWTHVIAPEAHGYSSARLPVFVVDSSATAGVSTVKLPRSIELGVADVS